MEEGIQGAGTEGAGTEGAEAEGLLLDEMAADCQVEFLAVLLDTTNDSNLMMISHVQDATVTWVKWPQSRPWSRPLACPNEIF